MTVIIYREESYLIIGACMRVHQELGGGFLEAVYHEALEKEFSKSNIPYESQKKLSLFYGGQRALEKILQGTIKKLRDHPLA